MIPVSSLCQDRGLPWWMPHLPVAVERGTMFHQALECLSPWAVSISNAMGVDMAEWFDVLVPDARTPRISLHLTRHISIGQGQGKVQCNKAGMPTWHAGMVGSGGEDYGNPDEMPFDVLAGAMLVLEPRCLLVDDEGMENPILDAGNEAAFVMSSTMLPGRSLGLWVSWQPPSFSDFVNLGLLRCCLPHGSPRGTMQALQAFSSNISPS